MLSIPQLERIRNYDPYTYEALKALKAAIDNIARQTGADPEGIFTTTPNITAVNVTVANGLANIQIVDNAFINNPQLQQGRAITYFVEFATDAGFTQIFQHESWHAVRNQNVFVGNQTFYVRAYSQLQGSAPSQAIYAAQNPLTGGGVAPPTQQAYQGSGPSKTGAAGYGVPLRSQPFNPKFNRFGP